MVTTKRHEVATKRQDDVRDLTGAVAKAIAGSGLTAGLATVAVVGSTAGVTTIEFEPGAVSDLNRALAALVPRDGTYEHHLRWGETGRATSGRRSSAPR